MDLSSLRGLALLKARIARVIHSCRTRHVVFGHTLVTGLGGTGKTALANAVAGELNYFFAVYEAAALSTRSKLLDALLRSSHDAQVAGQALLFFIDEIHRLKDQEALYYPMTHHSITAPDGEVHFHEFCLFGATTRVDKLDQGSLVTRFKNRWEIGRYDKIEIEQILYDIFAGWNVICQTPELRSIAERCLGIPRIASNLAVKIRDEVYYRGGDHKVTREDIRNVFQLEELDGVGLGKLHLGYLMELLKAKGPRGLNMLAARIGQNPSVVEDTIEPILFALGFIDTTPRGRKLTEQGQVHLAGQGLA